MRSLREQLPPMNSLVVFEASARHLSFTAAAEEMGVSQAAASRQVRSLEEHLGLRLFRRDRRRISLTRAGDELFAAVAMGLGHIARAIEALSRGNQITVATSIAFSFFWLMPRATRFYAAHPNLELRLVTSDSSADWLAEQVDAAVIYGAGNFSSFTARPLFGDEIIAVAHPRYFEGRRPPRTAADLLGETLLQMETEHASWFDWRDWLRRCGAEVTGKLQGPRLNNYPITIQAACDGQGVALGWRRLVEPQLAAGSLMRVVPDSIVPEETYRLQIREGLGRDRRVLAFCNWITAEGAEDWS